MNTANKQTSNLNNDFQNSNLANSDSGKFSRDYDKEPIVLKNYEEAYQVLLVISPFMIGMTTAIYICGNNNYTSGIEIVTGCIYVLLLILFFVLLEFIGYKKEQPILKIKNSSVEFYEKGKKGFCLKSRRLKEVYL